MGLSSSTKTTDSTQNRDPSAYAMPYITSGANSLQSSYDKNSAKLQSGVDSVTGLLPGAVQGYQNGNPTLTAATDYNKSVLKGDYLNNNPYLQKSLDASNNDIRNQTEAALGLHGLTGGSVYADIISRNIANNENQMRGADYSHERDLQGQAAGQAPGMVGADNARLAPLLSLLGVYGAPMDAANANASALAGLLGQYATATGHETVSSSPSLMDSFGRLVSGVSSSIPGIGPAIGSSLGLTKAAAGIANPGSNFIQMGGAGSFSNMR